MANNDTKNKLATVPSQTDGQGVLGQHVVQNLPLSAGGKTPVAATTSITGTNTIVYYHPPKGNGLA